MTLFILTKAPYSDATAYEGLEAILVSGAFEQQPKLLFRDAGVLQLLADQHANRIGVRSLGKGLQGLKHYEVTEYFACKDSLHHYNLSHQKLAIPVTTLTPKEMRNLIATQTVVATF